MATAKKTTNKIMSSKLDLNKSVSELQKVLLTKRQDLLDSRKSHKSGEMVNPRAITELKKDIARILTKLRHEEINSQKGEK